MSRNCKDTVTADNHNKASDEERSCRFIELAPLPKGAGARYSSLTHTSSNTIAYASPNRSSGIWAYDVVVDEWELIVPYSRRLRPTNGGDWKPTPISFDEHSKTLLFATENRRNTPIVTAIDKDTGKVTASKAMAVSYECSSDQSILSIDGEIHFVSRPNDIHLVWSADSEHVRRATIGIADVRDGECSDLDTEHVLDTEGGTAVHVPSTNTILLFGGGTETESASYEAVSEVFKASRSGTDGRWCWERAPDGEPMAAVNAVVTRDGEYVVICDVSVADTEAQCVHVVALEDGFKWTRTAVTLPADSIAEWGEQLMFRTGDAERSELTVHGFVRRQHLGRDTKTMQAMPTVLMGLILDFFSEELIHWATERRHFAIPLQDILASRCEEAADSEIEEQRRRLALL